MIYIGKLKTATSTVVASASKTKEVVFLQMEELRKTHAKEYPHITNKGIYSFVVDEWIDGGDLSRCWIYSAEEEGWVEC